MHQKTFRVVLLLAWCFLLSTFANAQGWWHTPGKSDILTDGGIANTLVVQLINYTPYDIVIKDDQMDVYSYLHNNPTNLLNMYDATALNPDSTKAFMFAPLGVPTKVPRVPPEAFNYTPGYVNTTTRPYTFVLSWDDRAYTVKDNWITWIIKGVECRDSRCGLPNEDVELGLFITRNAPDNSLTADYYWDLAKDLLRTVTSAIAIVIMPENPVAWKDFIIGGLETEQDAFNAAQIKGDQGSQWYIAAYPFPAPFSYCTSNPTPPGCTPSNAQATDGVEANWSGPNGGWAQQEIVVTTELLRGRESKTSYETSCGYSAGALGAVPVMIVTIMTADEWGLANTKSMATAIATGSISAARQRTLSPVALSAAKIIHKTLKNNGRRGLVTLLTMIRDLNQKDRRLLRDMLASWRAGKRLTLRQQAFLYMLALDLRYHVMQGKEG